MALKDKFAIVGIFVTTIISGCDGLNSTENQTAFAGLGVGATIGDAREKLGDYKSGHGPYVWFHHPQGGKRIFEAWFIPNQNMTNIDDVKISFIYDVDREPDTDVVLVVWPPELKGENPKEVMKMTYGDAIKIR